jgi:hypothetical protein
LMRYVCHTLADRAMGNELSLSILFISGKRTVEKNKGDIQLYPKVDRGRDGPFGPPPRTDPYVQNYRIRLLP